jgi:hypothetical protein
VSGILDLFPRLEVDEFLNRSSCSNENSTIKEYILDLILAIGSQCRVSSSLDSRHSRVYFVRGQQKAMEGMLEDPSITMIWAFLLMAFYLLGACRRNSAFMYLGVAARAAHLLGLHETNQYCPLKPAEQQLR